MKIKQVMHVCSHDSPALHDAVGDVVALRGI